MLETDLKKLTAAVEANTAALIGNAVAGKTAAAVIPAAAVTPAAAAKTAIDIPVDVPPAAASAKTIIDDADAAPVVVTKKQIIEIIIKLAQDKGRETAAALLAEYGAAKIPELKDESLFPEILAKATALLS